MKVAVYDTYVTRKDGKLMHFDILVPDTVTDEQTIHNYGKTYLKGKDQSDQPLTTRECKFCHIEEASDEMVRDILQQGFSIIEMQGCN